jgi:hypothetical protein
MIWTPLSFFGQLFDAMVGQVVSVLGGGSRPIRGSLPPWSGGGPRDAAGGTTNGPPPSVVQVQPWQPARITEAEAPEGELPFPKNLWVDEIKLVNYGIVSLRRCHERTLHGGQLLVTIPMTPETFSTWVIACYLQAEDIAEDRRDAVARERRNAIPYEEKKYLRVAYEVLNRWPFEPDDCCDDTREIRALHGIRDAILELGPRPAAALSAPLALPPAEIAAPEVPVAAPEEPEVSVAALEEPAAEPAGLAEAEPSREEKKVLKALKKGPAAKSQLIGETGLAKNQVNKAIKGLEAAGRIRRIGESFQTRYELTEPED